MNSTGHVLPTAWQAREPVQGIISFKFFLLSFLWRTCLMPLEQRQHILVKTAVTWYWCWKKLHHLIFTSFDTSLAEKHIWFRMVPRQKCLWCLSLDDTVPFAERLVPDIRFCLCTFDNIRMDGRRKDGGWRDGVRGASLFQISRCMSTKVLSSESKNSYRLYPQCSCTSNK